MATPPVVVVVAFVRFSDILGRRKVMILFSLLALGSVAFLSLGPNVRGASSFGSTVLLPLSVAFSVTLAPLLSRLGPERHHRALHPRPLRRRLLLRLSTLRERSTSRRRVSAAGILALFRVLRRRHRRSEAS